MDLLLVFLLVSGVTLAGSLFGVLLSLYLGIEANGNRKG